MEIWAEIKRILEKLWDELYKFLVGDIMGEELNEDWFITDQTAQ